MDAGRERRGSGGARPQPRRHAGRRRPATRGARRHLRQGPRRARAVRHARASERRVHVVCRHAGDRRRRARRRHGGGGRAWSMAASRSSRRSSTASRRPSPSTVDLTGARELQLVVVDAGDGNVNDEVDWADARVDMQRPRRRGAGRARCRERVGRRADGSAVVGAGAGRQPATASSRARCRAPLISRVVDVDANSASGIVPPGAYWVRVRARQRVGMEPAQRRRARWWSTARAGVPLAPGDLAATVSGAAVTLTWAPPLERRAAQHLRGRGRVAARRAAARGHDARDDDRCSRCAARHLLRARARGDGGGRRSARTTRSSSSCP